MNNNNNIQGIEVFADADDLDEVESQPGLVAIRTPPQDMEGLMTMCLGQAGHQILISRAIMR